MNVIFLRTKPCELSSTSSLKRAKFDESVSIPEDLRSIDYVAGAYVISQILNLILHGVLLLHGTR